MPRRDDLHKILVLGSGPIVIGQAAEFDYSGAQACKVLLEEGYEVVLVNSNPATIMTDPEFATATYIEPLLPASVAKVIEREKPDAMLPTLGGGTALDLARQLSEDGTLAKHRVELIGADYDAIRRAEDRDLFRATMERAGLRVPRSAAVKSMREADRALPQVGLPAIVRPGFTMGGAGGGIARTETEYRQVVAEGLAASPIGQALIEESVIGWGEFELEVMRDRNDNVVIVCSIENVDPMGVHTGDSVTVAPQQTLTDRLYQRLRDQAIAVIRAVGVETGGSNVQFAVNPATEEIVVIEVNPRVSRSSALASKATGFPIAKIAAKLAVGYTLDEIPNDITKKTPACFEPSIDYVVVKIPRWTFEKFAGADETLGTKMKSVGEAMAIGRTFCEALQKGFRSLEKGLVGVSSGAAPERPLAELAERLRAPTEHRVILLEQALYQGMSPSEAHSLTRIDPWFIDQVGRLAERRRELAGLETIAALDRPTLLRAKRLGFSDAQLANLLQTSEDVVRDRRISLGVVPVYKTVDTCAAEFEAHTPYYYSTYEEEDEVEPSDTPRVLILGSGPNRIGQGIEFDYCCVHAAFALAEAGYETIMLNCNPETVSTDYDTSDRLYFEPLTVEDVMNVIEAERAAGDLVGVVVALGGQTPLKLASALPEELVLGTSPASIDAAEDRERWGALCARLEIPQPAGGTATTVDEALAVVDRIGYPALLRPSYVLGGRAMEIVYDEAGPPPAKS